MAVFSLADFTTSPSAMPVQYRELVNNVQRLTPTLRTLSLVDGMTANNINFDVKLDGKTAGAADLDGASLPTATADLQRSVSLPYGSYAASMQLTDKLRRVSGAIQGHDFLKNLIQQDLIESLSALAKQLNTHIYSGSGSSNQMTGLTTAVAASGAYGGLTATDWIATVSENSGTKRNTSIPIIRTHVATMSAANGNTFGRPDLAFCKPAIFDVVLGLFTPTQQAYLGQIVQQPDVIYTASGKVSRTGFRAFTWASEGITFIEDPAVTHTTSTYPTDGIYFLNSGAVGLEQLRPAEMSMTDAQSIAAAQEMMGPIAGLTFELQPRGRTKFATEWDATCMVGLKVKCRAATGWLGDLQ